MSLFKKSIKKWRIQRNTYIPWNRWGLKICLGNACFKEYFFRWTGRCRGAVASLMVERHVKANIVHLHNIIFPLNFDSQRMNCVWYCCLIDHLVYLCYVNVFLGWCGIDLFVMAQLFSFNLINNETFGRG